MKNRCKHFQVSSSYVRQWIAEQPAAKEESLTDWLLYNVSKNVPSVIYRAFTRHQEARTTGADWEWWILFSKQYLRLRVQAKKVFPSADNYPGLAHTNVYGLQIDMLLANAKRANAIPLYALYSAEDKPTMCKQSQGNHANDGVFIAGASRLYTDFISGVRQRVTSTDLLSRSLPFSCFACCPLAQNRDGTISEFLKMYFTSELGEDKVSRGLHLKLPTYVESLLQHQRENVPDWWEEEFQSELHEFNAILVHDYRDI